MNIGISMSVLTEVLEASNKIKDDLLQPNLFLLTAYENFTIHNDHDDKLN